MCGRLPEAEQALTALGYATQVIFLLMVMMIGLTVGTVALVARAWGAEQIQRVQHIVRQSTGLTLVLAVTVAVVGNLLAPSIVELLGASDHVIKLSLDYLRPMLSFGVMAYLVVLYGAVMRGVGNTLIPFGIAFVKNGLNVLFNYCLILGNFGFPALGIEGAAIGTILSECVALCVFVYILRAGLIDGLKLRLLPRRVDRLLAGELMRVGAPAALDMVVLNAGFLSIVGMLGSIDEITVAAHSIGLRIQSLAFVPGLSIAQATGAMVGQALGSGERGRARDIVKVGVLLSTVVMSSIGLIIIYFASPIVSIFDVQTGELRDHALLWIKILGVGMPAMGVYIGLMGMFQGSGQTNTSLKINATTTLFLQIPASYIFGLLLGFGPVGVWVPLPAIYLVKSLCGFWVFKRDRWAKTGVKA
jgi:putative MATE family efflux protein